MSFYVEIQSQSCGTVTAKCGTPSIAGRLSNADSSEGAGNDAAWVNRFRFELTQAHDALGGVGSTMAPFTHALILYLPDYEPLISAAANVMNKHDVITALKLTSTRRLNDAKQQVTHHYSMANGILTHMRHEVFDQTNTEQKAKRGELMLGFSFQKVQADDHIAQTSGVLQTNSSAA